MNNNDDLKPTMRDPRTGRAVRTPITETPTPEWDWDHHDDYGYLYPGDAHVSPRPAGHPGAYPGTLTGDTAEPGIDAGTVLVVLAGLFVAIAVIVATLLTDHDTTRRAAPALSTAAQASTMATATRAATTYAFPTLSVPLSPYRSPGIWYVPTDLPPGRYLVIVTGELGGYWERCTDAECAPGKGLAEARTLAYGATETILDVLAGDYLVKTSGLELIPA